MRIGHNMSAIFANRQMQNVAIRLDKSIEKLASGELINRAGDDAAGLAISEGLKADIRALNQASRNASDGISMLQTAEGAMDEVSNILQRMKELAQQSLNGTLGDTERGYLNDEYTALMEEIDRIARRRMNGSATSLISSAVCTRVTTPRFSSASWSARELMTVASMPM